LDTRLLSLLRESSPGWVSSEVLRQGDGVSRVTISKRVQKLQGLGYKIESSTRKGYRLLGEPNDLHADDLKARLAGTDFYATPFILKQETGSTNDDLRKLAEEGAPEGTVLFSERQREGRGRRGRTWYSQPGDSLLFSILLRPPFPPGQGTLIPLLAATAVYRALTSMGIDNVGIKWPNDVLIEDKKVCGILCEMSVSLEGIEYALLGMGLNVSTPAGDFPEELQSIACSLNSATGKQWDRADVMVQILEDMAHLIQQLWDGDTASILEGWKEGAVTPGQQVDVTLGDGSRVSGQARGVTQEGALVLKLNDGSERVFHSGEVSVRPTTL